MEKIDRFRIPLWYALIVPFAMVLSFGVMLQFSMAQPAPVPISIEDTDIAKQVKRELARDPAIPAERITAETYHGVVTLSGTVNNLLTSERATRIAETVRGVTAVVNRIEVEPLLTKPLELLEQDVRNALLYDAATDSYELEVSANATGHVRLSGTVDSWQERALAEKVAKGVNGVIDVFNDIDVQAKTARADNEINYEIERRLDWDTLVDAALIEVRVKDGKVTLSGAVGSAAEKRRAQEDAHVAGVQAVNASALKVETWAGNDRQRHQQYTARSDLEIREAIQDAFVIDPRLSAFSLEIGVDQGKVTLHGVVDNIQARHAAIRDARNTVGVVEVKSLIKVQPVIDRDDKTITENVRRALTRNPFVTSYPIEVRVTGQRVYLNGYVTSYFEKAEAELAAFRASGVTEVVNRLSVRQRTPLAFDPYVSDWPVNEFPWYDQPQLSSEQSDWAITQAINEELIWSPFVDRDDVNIYVEDGVVTLSGTVQSRREYDAARKNAFDGGAIAVINRIKVK